MTDPPIDTRVCAYLIKVSLVSLLISSADAPRRRDLLGLSIAYTLERMRAWRQSGEGGKQNDTPR